MTAACCLTNRPKTVACAAATVFVCDRLGGNFSTSNLSPRSAIADSCHIDSTAADLAEQAPQEPREHHQQAVVAGTSSSLGTALHVFDWPHGLEHDAQVVLPRDLALGLA